jgi:hypothetical protein
MVAVFPGAIQLAAVTYTVLHVVTSHPLIPAVGQSHPYTEVGVTRHAFLLHGTRAVLALTTTTPQAALFVRVTGGSRQRGTQIVRR